MKAAAANVMAIIGDAFPEIRRGRATGVVMTAFSVASIAGSLAARDIASFGHKRTFESHAAGVVTRKAMLAGLLLEKSNRSFGGLEIAEPQRNTAARPRQRQTQRARIALCLRIGHVLRTE